jgi:L-lactate dehydrogenase
VLGRRLGIDPAKVEALILGEHGDSMVPAFSLLAYEGVPLPSLVEYSQESAKEAFVATRAAGAECLRLKGGAGYAVGLAVRQVVTAILQDAGEVLPVSTLQRSGEFAGVAFSLPTRVGRRGVLEVLTPKLSEEEHKGLLHSAEVLRETLRSLAGRAAA